MTTIVADIGGTNTRVALCDTPDSPREVARFSNAEFGSLDAVIRHYLAERGHPRCTVACVGVAGPVLTTPGAASAVRLSPTSTGRSIPTRCAPRPGRPMAS